MLNNKILSIALVVPDSYLILSSNQYNDVIDCVQDPLCSRTSGTSSNGEGCSQAEILLTCAGLSSRLFDGDTGNDVPNDPEDNDLLQYYTWQQGLTPSPYIAMIFNQPLVELPNIAMYFYDCYCDQLNMHFLVVTECYYI